MSKNRIDHIFSASPLISLLNWLLQLLLLLYLRIADWFNITCFTLNSWYFYLFLDVINGWKERQKAKRSEKKICYEKW